ncbi:MAG TPA: hypothetical protein ENJ82_03025 [Bacteroidetes bacterium]|nr:hypothetical protein [Bacteroidota bacterium]
MMRTFLLVLSALALSLNAHAQASSQDIEEIREQFKWINAQKDFERVYFDNDEFIDELPSEGCGMEAYYKDGEVYKIVEECFGSTQLYTTEYYLKNEQLIFVYSQESEFVRIPGTGEESEAEVYYENRVYYKDGEIIRHLEKGVSVVDKPIDYQEQYRAYKKLIDTKLKYAKQYELLQGIWINADDIDDWFNVIGVRALHYNRADYLKSSRIWFDGRYLWFHNTEYREEDRKFELLELTDEKLAMQDRLSGEVFVYEKKR